MPRSVSVGRPCSVATCSSWRRNFPAFPVHIVSCSRPGRAPKVHSCHPPEADTPRMLPPWRLCLPDHQRSTLLGLGVPTRSVYQGAVQVQRRQSGHGGLG